MRVVIERTRQGQSVARVATLCGYPGSMPYPLRPTRAVLPQFEGAASTRQSREQRERLLDFCAVEYRAGRSIHELAEVTGRSQAAVRRALDQAGVPRRRRGAYRLSAESEREPAAGGDRPVVDSG